MILYRVIILCLRKSRLRNISLSWLCVWQGWWTMLLVNFRCVLQDFRQVFVDIFCWNSAWGCCCGWVGNCGFWREVSLYCQPSNCIDHVLSLPFLFVPSVVDCFQLDFEWRLSFLPVVAGVFWCVPAKLHGAQQVSWLGPSLYAPAAPSRCCVGCTCLGEQADHLSFAFRTRPLQVKTWWLGPSCCGRRV